MKASAGFLVPAGRMEARTFRRTPMGAGRLAPADIPDFAGKSLRNYREIPVFGSREAETYLDDTARCTDSDIPAQSR